MIGDLELPGLGREAAKAGVRERLVGLTEDASRSSRTEGARRSRCAFGAGMPMRSFPHFFYSRVRRLPCAWIQERHTLGELQAGGTSGPSVRRLTDNGLDQSSATADVSLCLKNPHVGSVWSRPAFFS